MLFGASIHPYRKDAVAELERCVGLGAVLLKWLPVVPDFNPADQRCFPFYEALAHHRLRVLLDSNILARVVFSWKRRLSPGDRR
jgi:uncharacterized protein